MNEPFVLKCAWNKNAIESYSVSGNLPCDNRPTRAIRIFLHTQSGLLVIGFTLINVDVLRFFIFCI